MIPTTEEIQIAKTIKSQIHPFVLMSIGANRWGTLPQTKENAGGFGFRFQNTSKIKKGQIKIYLAYNDTYTVIMDAIDRENQKIHQEVKDVYCDQLNTTLDNLAETKEQLKGWTKH